MCLYCKGDDTTQVNPEGPRRRDPIDLTRKQSTNRRIMHMQNMRKQKRKQSKLFSKPIPDEEPELLPDGTNALPFEHLCES
ncbi:coiled-coil domain-containing protein 179 [Tenrec ecaudatus]|uniref:coiled-coil domain-containing protein 179 n=1 Tax=Tenrec ecaudatus TaxID=94439 RepID=UPI003F59D9E4